MGDRGARNCRGIDPRDGNCVDPANGDRSRTQRATGYFRAQVRAAVGHCRWAAIDPSDRGLENVLRVPRSLGGMVRVRTVVGRPVPASQSPPSYAWGSYAQRKRIHLRGTGDPSGSSAGQETCSSRSRATCSGSIRRCPRIRGSISRTFRTTSGWSPAAARRCVWGTGTARLRLVSSRRTCRVTLAHRVGRISFCGTAIPGARPLSTRSWLGCRAMRMPVSTRRYAGGYQAMLAAP